MEELIALLEKFQHAYTARDLTMAEIFIDEVFVAQEPAYYGTSPAEQCVGAGRILRLIGYDWTVWGTLLLDFDSLVAHDYGEAMDFLITGYVDWEIGQDEFLSRAMMDVKDMVLRGGDTKDMLYSINALSSKMLMESERGSRHMLPIRMSGMAVKEDGLLKFSHIHISHPTQTYPDCRIAH